MTLTTAPLTPEQQLVSEYYQHQALLCQWFATLFARELDEASVQTYLKGGADPLLDELELIEELAPLVRPFRQAIASLILLREPRLELAADFASLFLSDARHSPAPYASLYLDEGRFSGPSLSNMQQRLNELNMAVSESLNEPADHLSIMLEYLAARYQTLASLPTPSEEAELVQFSQQELASWLPQWAQRAQQLDTASAFYPSLMRLLSAYICA
ncbi:molecular chaperone TorD [Oceanisphaera avium]|uniref:Molecular chaperone TorD n=1 Tax=Oceanisphaera avium TaxID=1903694 RepID=A0A1Y0CVY3_9GAMM|nr:molecular chaperone TorD [Oceanisphaera avium]ART79491.1 molecular chaperone TorD [Oceanisphaera avium]